MTTSEQLQDQVNLINELIPESSQLIRNQLEKLIKVLNEYVLPLTPEEEITFTKMQRFTLKLEQKRGDGREEKRQPESPQPQSLPLREPVLEQQCESPGAAPAQAVAEAAQSGEQEIQQLELEMAEYRDKIEEYEQSYQELKQQYADQLNDAMSKESTIAALQQQIKQLQQSNEQANTEISQQKQQILELQAQMQSTEQKNLNTDKINSIFSQIQAQLKQIDLVNGQIDRSQPKSLARISQQIIEMKQQNQSLASQLQGAPQNELLCNINDQIEKYQSFVPLALQRERRQLEQRTPPRPSDLQAAVDKISGAFRPRAVQLQRVNDNQWVYEKTGVLLDIEFSERGNVVIVREGGVDVKPALLSQYLRDQEMGGSRASSAQFSRSGSRSRSQSPGVRMGAKKGYTSMRM